MAEKIYYPKLGGAKEIPPKEKTEKKPKGGK
jgi:hypothetical protein